MDNYFPITLPSRCLPYKDIKPESIQIRPFRGTEEELIAELGMTNLKSKFVLLLNNVLKGISAANLTGGDAKYIMLWEAINSYTNFYPVRLVCENCIQKIEVVVDLNKIEVKQLPEDFVQPGAITLSTGETVQLRLLTLAEEVQTFEASLKGDSTYLLGYALGIVDDKLKKSALIEKLQTMSVKDLGSIRAWYDKNEHGPDMIGQYTCPKCGWEGEVIVPFRFDRFISAVSSSKVSI